MSQPFVVSFLSIVFMYVMLSCLVSILAPFYPSLAESKGIAFIVAVTLDPAPQCVPRRHAALCNVRACS